MGGLRHVLELMARGELSVDEGLHDLEERLRPPPSQQDEPADD